MEIKETEKKRNTEEKYSYLMSKTVSLSIRTYHLSLLAGSLDSTQCPRRADECKSWLVSKHCLHEQDVTLGIGFIYIYIIYIYIYIYI